MKWELRLPPFGPCLVSTDRPATHVELPLQLRHATGVIQRVTLTFQPALQHAPSDLEDVCVGVLTGVRVEDV